MRALRKYTIAGLIFLSISCNGSSEKNQPLVKVPSSDFVLLDVVGGAGGVLNFIRVNSADGSVSTGSGSTTYSAPSGKGLVITEVDWQFERGTPGGNVTFRVFIFKDTGPRNFDRRAFESTAILGSNGGGGLSTTLNTGFLVPSGVKLRVDLIGAGVAGAGGTRGALQHCLIRGYLVNL